ncbi:hypothetical protein MPSEU_001097100 [Mayamaea pseudoterrestris]|nr:hypothetical protein MPSEU_001097100 [Mayamaea pseudoterrestris]
MTLHKCSLCCLLLLHNTIAWVNQQPTRFVASQTARMASKSNSGEQHHSSDLSNATESSTTDSIRILGVGGGIGSGKSTACKLLANELGCMAHIDADAVAHTVYQPGSQCIRDIAKQFDSGIVQENGEIDRKKLGSIVFSDRGEMKKLEAIVWPHTKGAILREIETIKSEKGNGRAQCKYPVIVVEAAMLLDADWNDFLNGLWIVTTHADNALKRLMETRNLSQEEAQKRIDAQVTRRGVCNLAEEIDRGLVSAVIENNGDTKKLLNTLAIKLEDKDSWYKL